jgi:hypothetical protein
MNEQDLGALARSIIDSNRYMTLGTADGSGVPWVSPVWYASADYREFSGSRLQTRGIRATSAVGQSSRS